MVCSAALVASFQCVAATLAASLRCIAAALAAPFRRDLVALAPSFGVPRLLWQRHHGRAFTKGNRLAAASTNQTKLARLVAEEGAAEGALAAGRMK